MKFTQEAAKLGRAAAEAKKKQESDARQVRYKRYCAQRMTAKEISVAEGIGSSGVWHNLRKFGLTPKIIPHKQRGGIKISKKSALREVSSKRQSFNPGRPKTVTRIYQGEVFNLKTDGQFLHLSHASLTDDESFAARLTAQQAGRVMRNPPFEGLVPVCEVGRIKSQA